MRLLLDECVPQELRFHLRGHAAYTARYAGLHGLSDSDLIAGMVKAGYTVLVTLDQNVSFQQNLSKAGIAVIVIAARSSRLHDVLRTAPSVVRALDFVQPGQVVAVGHDDPT